MSAIDKVKETLKNNMQVATNKNNSIVPQTMAGLKTDKVKDVFSLYKDQIANMLPKHLTADRVIQLATTLITRSPELASCSTSSLIGAVMQAGILGFEPVQSLGQCYLIPFNNNKSGKKEVQFIIGYKGMLELARRSNEISTIYAQAVYENDVFEYEFGLDPKLIHKPAKGERGGLEYVYAVAKFTNGGFAFEVMTKNDCEKIRKRSQGGNSKYSPWSNADDYPEMCKKTVIRRLFKFLPISIEKSTVLNINSDAKVIDLDQPNIFVGGAINLNATDETEYSEVVDESTGEIKVKEVEVLEQIKPNTTKKVLEQIKPNGFDL